MVEADSIQAGRDLDCAVASEVFGAPLLPRDRFDPNRAVYYMTAGDTFERDGERVYTTDAMFSFDLIGDVPDPAFFSAFPDAPNQSKAVAVPPYSTDIKAAWEVVEALRARGIFADVASFEGNYSCDLFRSYARGLYESLGCNSEAETAPLAICRAALKAVSSKEVVSARSA